MTDLQELVMNAIADLQETQDTFMAISRELDNA